MCMFDDDDDDDDDDDARDGLSLFQGDLKKNKIFFLIPLIKVTRFLK